MTAPRPGRVMEITSTANPLIKDIRALAMRKRREAGGLFLAEGLKLVTDALDGGWSVRQMIVPKRPAGEGPLAQAAARARATGADILTVSDKVMEAIVRRDNPQPALAVIGQRWVERGDLRPSPGSLWLGLDRVRDPGNLGTAIRTADCVGASGVLLIGDCTDPFSLEAVRATMGSIFHVPLTRMDEAAFLSAGWPGQSVGAHLDGAIDYRRWQPGRQPVLLLMGNEQAGLTEALAASCDALLRIPMNGRADSLNLAVATGIMLFELRRAHLRLDEAAA